MSAPVLCDACNGTGRRGLLGGVKAYRTCETCAGTGRVAAGEKPLSDPRRVKPVGNRKVEKL